jgi:glutamyl-tRNA synthetase
MGEGNKKLSKRDPEASFQMYKDQGYLPEGLINYLALLGFSYGDDIEFFSKEQLANVFDISRVNPSPARFDLKKCTAINADWMRAISPEEFGQRVVPYLHKSGVIGTQPTDEQAAVITAAVPLIQERMETLGQAAGMLGFLLVADADFAVEEPEREGLASTESQSVIAAAIGALEPLPDWTTEAIEIALRAALIEGLGLKPKVAFGAVRVAITGRRISPPLFESMEILGHQRSLARLRSALA